MPATFSARPVAGAAVIIGAPTGPEAGTPTAMGPAGAPHLGQNATSSPIDVPHFPQKAMRHLTLFLGADQLEIHEESSRREREQTSVVVSATCHYTLSRWWRLIFLS